MNFSKQTKNKLERQGELGALCLHSPSPLGGVG